MVEESDNSDVTSPFGSACNNYLLMVSWKPSYSNAREGKASRNEARWFAFPQYYFNCSSTS